MVRSGETLSRVGKMAELFEDHSPLQLMAAGHWRGRPFTLVGRLQYKGETGAWTEWNALFDDGTAGVLGEDNGAYVFLVPAAMQRDVPPAAQFRVGATTAIEGKPYNVASNQQVSLVSAQGELPKLPALGQPFAMVELRSPDGEVLSVDYGSQPPQLSRGRSVRARGPDAVRPARREREGRKRPALRLPELRRAGGGGPGFQQEHHLPILQQPDRAGWQALAASCATPSRTSRLSR